MLALAFFGAGTAQAAPVDDSGSTVAAADEFGLFTPTEHTVVMRGGVTAETSGADDADGMVQPMADWAKVTGATYRGEQCGTNVIQKTSGHGKTTLTMSVQKSVATKWSATASISAGAVSAGMGWDVTKTYTVTDQTAFSVPSGKFGTIEAYPLYDVYSFNETSKVDGGKLGTGRALKPVGVCFNQWNE
ncbi:hypothetical protein ACIPSA_45090 [Streptomyces sp. NPDC086549]|uniref:hypothetical protein n=1 Tax=Streptomyces sp. NPDC086549 TaxID=3365752 RepID=UPI00380CD005